MWVKQLISFLLKTIRDIALKPIQEKLSWNYVLHIIYFSHFSFSAISQSCFHVRRELVSLRNHSIWQALFYFTEKVLWVSFWTVMESLIHFQKLWNHWFICSIFMLLKHATMPWSHCKLASYFAELFLVSDTEI